MNPQNGQILALASYPSYDLNEWVGGISQANFTALQQSGAENDYAIQGLYTPGSTFKLVTATAALQDGLIAPATPYNDSGTFKIAGCPAPGVNNDTGCILHDDPGDSGGTYNVTGALTVSSDAFFYNLGEMFWQQQAKYGDHADPERGDGVRRGDHHRRRPPRRGAGPDGRLPDAGQAACRGAQGVSRTPRRGSPATTSRWRSARARPCSRRSSRRWPTRPSPTAAHGMRPQVASEIVDPMTGKVVKKIEPKVTGTVAISPANYSAMLQGFEGVISNPHGTAYQDFQGFPAAWNLAGKTGTASNQQGPGAQQLVRGLRAEPQPAVPRAGRHRPGRVRRRRGGAARAQHLQLHRRQPGADQPGRGRRPRRPNPPLRDAADDPDHRTAGRVDDHDHRARLDGASSTTTTVTIGRRLSVP